MDSVRVQLVKSSWYGDETCKPSPTCTMANGQRYDKWAMTVAHRTLPFGTKLLLKNPTNGKSVVVTVYDRGPFVRGRSLDCSEGVARKLGFWRQGVEYLVAIRLNDVYSQPVSSSHLELLHSKARHSRTIRRIVDIVPEPQWTYSTPATLDNVEDMSLRVQVLTMLKYAGRLLQTELALPFEGIVVPGLAILEGSHNAVELKTLVYNKPLPEGVDVRDFLLDRRYFHASA